MTYDQCLALQKKLNLEHNAGLKEDGIYGPLTMAAEEKYLGKKDEAKPSVGDYYGAPWVNVDLDLLGRTETDAELTRRLAPHWKKVGLPGFVKKGLSGSDRAWCAMRVHYALFKVGVDTGKINAGAYSLSTYGVKSPFWFGALLDIKHKGGGRHACFFLFWIDEKKRIAATLDGNRANKFAVFATDLSGRGDTLVAGPRFPKGMTGRSPSKAEVLKKYPHLKVGGKGSSTR